MDFYTAIARYYDDIFPPNPTQVQFVQNLLKPNDRVLDVGCATGSLAIALAMDGHQVVGLDLDPNLIDIAMHKAEVLGETLHFAVADMREVGTNLPGGSSACVITVGNTLVHLEKPDVVTFITGAYEHLDPGGRLVIQIINYDRIIANEITELPLIDNECVRFERRYRLSGLPERIAFSTKLDGKETGETLNNTVVLYPLLCAELTEMIQAAGFETPERFGSFKGDPYGSDSYALVIVAKKPA